MDDKRLIIEYGINTLPYGYQEECLWNQQQKSKSKCRPTARIAKLHPACMTNSNQLTSSLRGKNPARAPPSDVSTCVSYLARDLPVPHQAASLAPPPGGSPGSTQLPRFCSRTFYYTLLSFASGSLRTRR
ncbi:hypothetical protein PR048_013040 [Dryococelus australis]|uniref:Uncharacterized protein n=1 Tax=Dryococelus australis TaxID=614101 RepID=A0ABQ9HR22_9NEOP|nr:hypothetical protein PR048_013040 [Dryococelus australis]